MPGGLCPLVCPAGFAGAGLFQAAIFAWALLGFAAVYHGAARRAYNLAVERMPQRTSITLSRSLATTARCNTMSRRCGWRLTRPTPCWTAPPPTGPPNVDHPDWPVRLVGTRYFVIIDVVDWAMDLSGGGAAFRKNLLEQIFRDVRMGRFQPRQHPARPRAHWQAPASASTPTTPALGLNWCHCDRSSKGTDVAGNQRARALVGSR